MKSICFLRFVKLTLLLIFTILIYRIEQQQLEIERLNHLCTMRGNEAKANDEKYQVIKKELDASQQAFSDIHTKYKSIKNDYEQLLERLLVIFEKYNLQLFNEN